MNWDMETNYICPSVVHHSTNNNYVHLSDCVLQTSPSTSGLQHPSTTKSNDDEQPIGHDELPQDGLIPTAPPTVQLQQSTNSIGTTKQNFPNVDLNGSKVIRLVRAKQATKRKSSLDTLIEVVQKELLRVNGQSTSTSPSSSPPHYSQTRSTTNAGSSSSSSKQVPHRSTLSSTLPSSHSASLTSQSNHAFKMTRKRVQHQNKRTTSNRHRTHSFNHEEFPHENDSMDEETSKFTEHDQHHYHQERAQESSDDPHADTENIEEIVRDTVDRLVAITLLNNAPFIVNMLTAFPGNNTESKPLINASASTVKPLAGTSSEYYRNDLALLSSAASDIRNSMQQQASPIKQQQSIILTPSSLPSNATFASSDSFKSPSTSTVFVAPRLINFQTVVPKPTTNIQIGNTKIILVSPSTTTSSSSLHPQSSSLINPSPIKLVKFTPSSSNSTLTLPKNVQIVLPSRTSHESHPTTATYRPLTKLMTACSIDQIPPAAQEVTITTSPPLHQTSTVAKPRRRSSTSTPTEKPVGKILRPIAKVLPVYSPTNSNHAANATHEEIIQPLTVNFPQALPRSSSTHGPMIYRMTSVNPNVPVFRVRAATAPTSTTIKTDAKPISMTTTTGLTYEPKQIHSTAAGGSVSVLACFKTTKTRNKERAIMPRPSATDAVEHPPADLPHRLTTNPINSSDLTNHRPSPSSTTVRLVHPQGLPTIHVESKSSSSQDSMTAETKRSPSHANSIQFPPHSAAIKTISTPLVSSRTARPLMEDKGIQCIDDEQSESDNTHPDDSSTKKRPSQPCDETWTMAADTLLRNVLSQYGFRFLDVHCQQNLSSKFDAIQANLVSGMIPTRDEFYTSVIDIKENLLNNGLSKISADNLEKLFHYFEVEYPKISDEGLLRGTNDRKRTRRQ